MRKNWIWALALLLIGGMASCKSSQSAYKAAYEKAQEKKIEEPAPAPVAEQQVVTTPSTTTTSSTSVRERSERINAVDGNDALLKEYNVIQNAEGWYRVVACSFDNRPAAVQAREALQARYPQFTDAWFLINK